jgi:hypothetical protein
MGGGGKTGKWPKNPPKPFEKNARKKNCLQVWGLHRRYMESSRYVIFDDQWRPSPTVVEEKENRDIPT